MMKTFLVVSSLLLFLVAAYPIDDFPCLATENHLDGDKDLIAQYIRTYEEERCKLRRHKRFFNLAQRKLEDLTPESQLPIRTLISLADEKISLAYKRISLADDNFITILSTGKGIGMHGSRDEEESRFLEDQRTLMKVTLKISEEFEAQSTKGNLRNSEDDN